MMLEVTKLGPGLWRWCAPHPEWKPEKGGPGGWEQSVGCVYHEAPGAVVLIDPLAPPVGSPDHQRFWEALDGDVGRHGGPVAVLLSNRYHVRSVETVYERYRGRPGATVWAHEAARQPLGSIVTDSIVEGQPLPGDVRAYSVAGLTSDELVFYLPSHTALVAADAILGAGSGELRVAPAAWAEQSEEGRARYRSQFRLELRRLLDLPFDRVLVSHGAPLLENGHPALARALDAPAWGE